MGAKMTREERRLASRARRAAQAEQVSQAEGPEPAGMSSQRRSRGISPEEAPLTRSKKSRIMTKSSVPKVERDPEEVSMKEEEEDDRMAIPDVPIPPGYQHQRSQARSKYKVGQKVLVRDLPKPLANKESQITEYVPKNGGNNYLVKSTWHLPQVVQLHVSEGTFYQLPHSIGETLRWKLEGSTIVIEATVKSVSRSAKHELEYKFSFANKAEGGSFRLTGKHGKRDVGRMEKN